MRVLWLATIACTCRTPPEPEAPHYEGAVALRLAAEAGDLPALLEAARELEGDQEEAGSLDGALGYAQVVEDREEAAYAAAAIAQACGSCHIRQGLPLTAERRLEDHPDVAETLWDAVVVGDQEGAQVAVEAWDRGTLGESPLEEVLLSCSGCHELPG